MAEAGAAHLLTSTLEKPSIFEVVAADSLNSTFYPALKRVVNYIASLNPRKYGCLAKYYDEIFLVLNGLVQNYYLNRNCGSLSETFYGLSRYSLKSNGFSRRDKYISLFCLAVFPYLLQKLDARIEIWKEDIYDKAPDSTTVYKKTAFNSYRTIRTMYELSKLVQYIFYLANLSQSHSVKLKLFELGLRYSPIQEETPFSWMDLINGKIKLSTIISSAIFRGLELTGFFLQFLQWWQSEATVMTLTSLPTPDPPEKDENSSRYFNICPLCFQSWKIPTVITVSGYVFCFKCISNHLRNHQFCPITNYAVSMNDLIRIYDDSDS